MEKPTLKELGGDFCEDTEQWFDAWRESPRTDDWDMPQWQFMKDCAVIHSMVYGQGMYELFPDLEKRLERLGLSFDAPAKQSNSGKVTTLEVLRARRAERVAKAAG